MVEETDKVATSMGIWCGQPIPRERRLEMGLEFLDGMMSRAMEDLDAMKAAHPPGKRNGQFTRALERLEDQLNEAAKEVVQARKVFAEPT